MKLKNFSINTTLIVVLLFLGCAHSTTQTAATAADHFRKVSAVEDTTGNWAAYGADKANSKTSKLNQITKENFSNLEVAWRWNSPDNDVLAKNKNLFVFFNESTPLAVNKFLYVVTALSQVAKIDGATGETVKLFDPRAYDVDIPSNNGFVHRGLTYWQSDDGSKKRILLGTGNAYLYMLDADSLEPISTFGEKGRIDLLKGLNLDGSDWPNRWDYGVTSPVSVCNGVVIVGSSIKDGISSSRNVRGDVRGFDILTGKKLWTFHTIPTPTEFGADSWKDGTKHVDGVPVGGENMTNGNTNVWTVMSVDEKLADGQGNLGLVYLPVSTPSNDWYGGKRTGNNLFGESLVCLSCITGERKWHYQMVHHGLWDYDLPAAPNLVDLKIKGKIIKSVVQVTKQGFAFAFDREKGIPIWPIHEKKLIDAKGFNYGKSKLEWTSPTQPVPSRPPPFDRQGISKEDLIDFSDDLNAKATALVSEYNYGPLYTPPTDQKKGTLVLPGWLGGASWAGAAFDESTQTLYVTSITDPIAAYIEKTKPLPETDPKMDPIYLSPFAKRLVPNLDGKIGSLTTRPFLKPPYGRVTAIDMQNGKIKWFTPLGTGPINDPVIKQALEKDPVRNKKWIGKNLGWSRRGNMLKIPGLLVVGQSGTYFPIGAAPKLNAIRIAIVENEGEQNLKAFDQVTGELVSEVNLFKPTADGKADPNFSGNAYGAPMTFLDQNGEQVIVVPVGGANKPAELVALKVRKK
jgi:quinoprotein glucose dehydrogenase